MLVPSGWPKGLASCYRLIAPLAGGWTSPIDAGRGVLYVGTGENYSTPADEWSDAIVALDLADGSIRWRRQLTAGDAYTTACYIPGHPNCPEEDGPDFDFGAAPATGFGTPCLRPRSSLSGPPHAECLAAKAGPEAVQGFPGAADPSP